MEGGSDGWREGERERGREAGEEIFVLCHTHVFYFRQEFFINSSLTLWLLC